MWDTHTYRYILTTDGDVDFNSASVRDLQLYLQRDKSLGAVCGRIHPQGSGPLAWFQVYEYALGHWCVHSSMCVSVCGCVCVYACMLVYPYVGVGGSYRMWVGVGATVCGWGWELPYVGVGGSYRMWVWVGATGRPPRVVPGLGIGPGTLVCVLWYMSVCVRQAVSALHQSAPAWLRHRFCGDYRTVF